MINYYIQKIKKRLSNDKITSFFYKKIPNKAPVIKVDSVPAIKALIPNLATSALRVGAMEANAPI